MGGPGVERVRDRRTGMIPEHGDQIAAALRRVVRPGASVLDLGGDFAQRAVLACRSGASRVVSVQSAASRPIAHALVAANGCHDRVEFVESAEAAAVGGRHVDVVLTEEPGGFLLYGRSLIDALRRFASSAVTPVPRREQLFVVVISSPEAYAHHVSPWDDNEWGLVLGAARHRALNVPSRFPDAGALAAKKQLGPSACWATVDYADLGVHTRSVQGRIEFVTTDAGVAHGLAIWSSVELADGITFEHVCAFFPWLEPVTLSVGDRVTVALRADAIGGTDVWSWTTGVHRQSDEEPATRFRQSTFFGEMEPMTRVRRAESEHRPSLSEAGIIARAVLTMIREGTTLRDISSRVAHDFPAAFSDPSAAMDTIARLASTYARVRT